MPAPDRLKTTRRLPVGLRPLRHSRFRWLWAVGVVSFFGTWIHNVAARWTVASQAGSPFLVTVVDALQALPIVLLSVVAGKLADTRDRRKVLVVINICLMVVSGTLGTLAAVGRLQIPVLFLLTALMGAFVALDNPVWQSTVPRQVPDEDVHGAVALVSTGYNAARTLGPTIGAWLLISAGAATAFFIDAVSFAVMALLVWRLLPPSKKTVTMAEPVKPLSSPVMRKLYITAFAFSILAMPAMSLLPIAARDLLRGGALAFGGLLSAFGIGAILAGGFVAGLAGKLGYNRFIAVCCVVDAAGMALLAMFSHIVVAMVAAALCGAGWLGAISITNSTVNTRSSAGTRGRLLAVYFIFAFAGQFGGSLLGGFAAQVAGLAVAFATFAVLLLVLAIGITRTGDVALSPPDQEVAK
ncbi:MFS transporter [Amycolatopsis sp. PS_44_ISF1]|uniref:MFS transporter n=1 Tax=Amycolatopsis sp. PS_44_ISF1 TaxID=2974917 RepID=UPI0028DE09C3|nr:MFS transporter [Amycolatopsis sp. PS_44_ISF1]MDT8912256.1 MFS transporter [Amycolatopsis sp. PS_44_ISF1]